MPVLNIQCLPDQKGTILCLFRSILKLETGRTRINQRAEGGEAELCRGVLADKGRLFLLMINFTCLIYSAEYPD